MGSGNCRDSQFFSQKGHKCFSIDQNLTENISIPNCKLIREDANVVMKTNSCDVDFDIIYMRWFLHAMPYHEAEEVFHNSFQRLKKEWTCLY